MNIPHLVVKKPSDAKSRRLGPAVFCPPRAMTDLSRTFLAATNGLVTTGIPVVAALAAMQAGGHNLAQSGRRRRHATPQAP